MDRLQTAYGKGGTRSFGGDLENRWMEDLYGEKLDWSAWGALM